MKTRFGSILAILALSAFNGHLFGGTNTRTPDDIMHGGTSGDNSTTNNFGDGGNGGTSGSTGDHGITNRPAHHLGDTNQIFGSEAFREHIVLVPTNNAAAGARGWADIDQENQNGRVLYRVALTTFGLPTGTNHVAVFLADGTSVSLGDLVVRNGRFSGADELLPSGVSASDITQISISDSNDVPLLIGDVNGGNAGTFSAFSGNVRLTAGPAAPNARGRALLSVEHRRGKTIQRFNLVANKLPPNTTFNILADGTQIGTGTSNKRGGLVVRNLQADLSTVHDITLVSATDGTAALTAHF